MLVAKGRIRRLARHGLAREIVFVGAHGPDEFGAQAKSGLEREGIAVSFFYYLPNTASGVALIILGGESRENIIAVAQSANNQLSPDLVKASESVFQGADAVLTQLEVPLATVEAVAELAAKYEIPLILNPAPARELPSTLLRVVYALTSNEVEAKILSGRADIELAAAFLRSRGVTNVVITLGPEGALLVTEEGAQRTPSPQVVPVDTVVAGDCFSAWLTVGIAQGRPISEAVAQESGRGVNCSDA